MNEVGDVERSWVASRRGREVVLEGTAEVEGEEGLPLVAAVEILIS